MTCEIWRLGRRHWKLNSLAAKSLVLSALPARVISSPQQLIIIIIIIIILIIIVHWYPSRSLKAGLQGWSVTSTDIQYTESQIDNYINMIKSTK